LVSVEAPGESLDSVAGRLAPGDHGARPVRFDEPTIEHTPSPSGAADKAGAHRRSAAAERLISSAAYVRRCAELARDAALALAHAHERGVIHRDIKPENLLLDRQGQVRLVDFGLARFFEDVTLTNTGALIGTPMYMSPEQVTGRIAVDPRTDVYSLGLVLYELLALERPIRAPTRETVLRQVVTKALRPISSLNRGVPPALEAAIHKATAKDPDERYASASAFAADLTAFLEGRPVAAPPYRYRLDEGEILARRPNTVVLAAGFVFTIAFVMTLIGLVSIIGTAVIAVLPRSPTRPPSSTPAELGRDLATYLVVLAVGLYGFRITTILLGGNRWARWAALAQGGLLYLAFSVQLGRTTYAGWLLTAAGSADLPPGLFVEATARFAAMWLVATAAAVCQAIWLLGRRARDWFRFAAQVRLEHQVSGTERPPS
jgi:hypothetical protein